MKVRMSESGIWVFCVRVWGMEKEATVETLKEDRSAKLPNPKTADVLICSFSPKHNSSAAGQQYHSDLLGFKFQLFHFQLDHPGQVIASWDFTFSSVSHRNVNYRNLGLFRGWETRTQKIINCGCQGTSSEVIIPVLGLQLSIIHSCACLNLWSFPGLLALTTLSEISLELCGYLVEHSRQWIKLKSQAIKSDSEFWASHLIVFVFFHLYNEDLIPPWNCSWHQRKIQHL